MDMKKMAGDKAAEYVKDGMVLGLGTGSTAFHLVNAVGELVKNGTIEFEEALSCCVNEGDLRMFAKRTI